MQDSCQRFIFDNAAIRGEIVHLGDSYQTIMKQRQYPDVIRQVLGEALVSAVLLAETIKFDGQLTLQFQSDGPIKTLVAKCNSKKEIRGLAQWREDIEPLDAASALGEGELVVTIDYDDQVRPYQSIIPIAYQTVTQALETYFLQSEQLPTKFYMAVTQQHAAGLLLQAMPELSSSQQDVWQEAVVLADTVKPEELCELDNTALVKRLFSEHDLRLFDVDSIRFKCNCSVERMQRAIVTLGEAEAYKILLTSKVVDVTCDYCQNRYEFDKAAVADIFTAKQ